MQRRTTIVLTDRLRRLAGDQARDQGISFGELVRRAIEKAVENTNSIKRKTDPFWADRAVFRGDVPRDISEHHDEYLYGDQ